MQYQPQTKNCQNCKNDFIIEPDDFLFYEKMKVPPPTFCPECRMLRRLLVRNERVLYRANCYLCKKLIFTIYHPDNNFIIYCSKCYNSNNWDPLIFGRNYNFSKPFFEQFYELQKIVPRKALHEIISTNSEYSNYVFNSKDAYLSFTVVDSNWIYYSRSADRCKECIDCYNILDCESCYECIQSGKNYGSSYIIESRNCVDCHFLFDAMNCTDCFMSSNIRNKKYVFKNKQLSKEEYKNMIGQINRGSIKVVKGLKLELIDLMKNSIHRYASIYNSPNSTGDDITNSKNIKDSFYTTETENAKFVMRTVGLKDSYDVWGSLQSELLYEVHGGARSSRNSKFVSIGGGTVDSEYTDFCINSQNIFGSISLNSYKYCILNKQYTKEEYFEMIDKIKKHMDEMPHIDQKGNIYKYGEFFPPICIPFSYNESAAQEYFPLTKEQILKNGYKYREPVINEYNFTLSDEDIPDDIKNVNSDILKEILKCNHYKKCNTHRCVGVFKITEDELNFYKKFNISLPTLCPNCRYYERLRFIHIPKLYTRNCMKKNCANIFKTTYAPNRPEIIYCEECYKKEVY